MTKEEGILYVRQRFESKYEQHMDEAAMTEYSAIGQLVSVCKLPTKEAKELIEQWKTPINIAVMSTLNACMKKYESE